MLRVTRPLFYAAQALKQSTGITGLEVHPKPLPALKSLYSETLLGLSSMPSTSAYRQATEALTKHRLQAVEKAGDDITAVERELGQMVEVIIKEAESEKELVSNMNEWKAWEPLEKKPHPDQWRYFDPTGDSL